MYKIIEEVDRGREFPVQETFKDAIDYIRGLWEPSHAYDNPINFKFENIDRNTTRMIHQTTSFVIKRLVPYGKY